MDTHKEEYKGYEINIIQDEDSSWSNPRENSNSGHMICFHNRYTLGDKHTLSIEGLHKIVNKKNVIALPIYMYDHSGIGLSTSNTQYPFNCPWDSGKIGYIYVTFEEIYKKFKTKRVTTKLAKKVVEILQSEVDVYSMYVQGEVYGYTIAKSDDTDNEIDSCWGFIGFDNCLQSAKEIVDNQ